MIGIGLTAPTDQEALGNRGGLVDYGLRHRRLAGAAGGLRDERQCHHRSAGEVVACLFVGDVEQLAEAPLGREPGERGLDVDARVAGSDDERPGLGRRKARLEVTVDQQAPHVLERDDPDELLDVDSPVTEGAPLLVGLSDLGGECDYALEAVLYLSMLRGHRPPIY